MYFYQVPLFFLAALPAFRFLATMRKDVFDFTSDLSKQFLNDLDSQLPNLTSYLEW